MGVQKFLINYTYYIYFYLVGYYKSLTTHANIKQPKESNKGPDYLSHSF